MIRPARRSARFLVLVAAALAVAGCGGGGPTLVPVRGKVTLPGGTPVHNGSVTFHPDAAKGNKSRAARLLGLTRAQLYSRIEKYGVQ